MNFNDERECRQAAADIRAGADVVERNGWYQGYYYRLLTDKPDADCPVCALGGLNVAIDGHPSGPGGLRRGLAQAALEKHVKGPVSTWNDAEGQTAEAVIKTMRECADKLEAAK